MSARRQEAESRGRRAEDLAALWLFLKGYRILGRREKTGSGELDIVARKGNVLAIVEVKARTTVESGLQAVSWHQQQRIVRGTSSFIGRRRDLANLAIRYDLMIVRPWRLPRHERQFFSADGPRAMDFN
ncbi:YraN family protein [Hyphobacterium sp. HN65]|uniref:UPF0102 protein V0U79_09845 n=1 Tax=Hyphobacterium lacteum TaxID=3116575 RepID=A0ABU7LRX6_9PROT|nr:YraN family protein [Hyphobacterium sp. HN65]MEE2526670.1 YraN family protein [Hyphobacterium sp. HN65]